PLRRPLRAIRHKNLAGRPRVAYNTAQATRRPGPRRGSHVHRPGTRNVRSMDFASPARHAFRLAAAHRLAALGVAAGALLAPGTAGAQSLLELYEAAHAYDAAYLSARSLAESAPYRVEQTRALMRPNVTVSAGASRDTVKPPAEYGYDSNTLQATIGVRQPLFNRANSSS